MSRKPQEIDGSRSPPATAYHFCPLNMRTIKNLCEDKLYFSSPSTFNDPLDCKPTIDIDCDLETLQKTLTVLINERVRQETLERLKQANIKDGPKSREHARRNAARTAEAAVNVTARQAKHPARAGEKAEHGLLALRIESELQRRYNRGVCCFSTSWCNPLLWSHYAEQHKGICLGFQLGNWGPPAGLLPVDYGGSRSISARTVAKAIVDADEDANADLDKAMFLRKAAEWTYEDEWRLISDEGLQSTRLELREVWFGLRCEPALQYTVASVLSPRQPEIAFFRVTTRHDSFALVADKDFTSAELLVNWRDSERMKAADFDDLTSNPYRYDIE